MQKKHFENNIFKLKKESFIKPFFLKVSWLIQKNKFTISTKCRVLIKPSNIGSSPSFVLIVRVIEAFEFPPDKSAFSPAS